MSGTHLFYNGVLLRDCEMQNWRESIVRDESGTDILYRKVSLTVESTLIGLDSANSTGGIAAPRSTIALPVVNYENLVDRMSEVRWRLNETRKDFWLAINGVSSGIQPSPGSVPLDDGSTNAPYRVVLAATGLSAKDLRDLKADSTASIGLIDGFSDFGLGTPKTSIERKQVIDLNNGPTPYDVVVTKVFGGRALRVTFSIDVCRCFCKPAGSVDTDTIPPVVGAQKVEGVISNRWSLSETLDDAWKSEHVIEGKLVVSDARYKPHAMRLLVQPRLFPYARVASRNFSTDKTGLALAYRFSIKETGPAAPKGVVDWQGTYAERSINGGKKLADITVRVTGQVNPVLGTDVPDDPGKEHKAKLIALAYRIAKSRVAWSAVHNPIAGSTPQTTTLVDMAVVEQIERPVVELRVSVLYADQAAGGGIISDNFGMRLENMGRSLENALSGVEDDYDPRWWQNPVAFPWDVDSETDASTDDGYGSYYDQYFQTPCSQWHTTPEGAIPPDALTRPTDISGGASAPSGPTPYTVFTLDPDMAASLDDPSDPAPGVPIPADQQGWSDAQVDYGYFQADIDTRYELGSGKIQLPLSKAQYGTGHTSVVVKLHCGLARRVITMVASRQGKWPQVPAPVVSLTKNNVLETYLDGEIIHDAPKLNADGKTYTYKSQIRWVYALSRLPNQNGDALRTASNPMDRTTPATNELTIADYFTFGEVEESPGPSTPLMA